MSAEEFRIVVTVGILWIVLNIKMAKDDIVSAIKELKKELKQEVSDNG